MDNLIKFNNKIQKNDEATDTPEDLDNNLIDESDIDVSKYFAVPFSRLTAYSTAFEPLVSIFQTAITGEGGSGLYFVDTGGKTMFQMKSTGKYIGSLKSPDGTVGGGQAQMIQLACNPAMLFMAAALSSMDKKLDDIKKVQREILDYLVRKDKAEIRGNLNSLLEIYENYKYNLDSEKYISTKSNLVTRIKNKSEEQIGIFRNQIVAKLNDMSRIHGDKAVKKQIQSVTSFLKEYQLALYLFAFSSFLEIMLTESFNSVYLSNISAKLNRYSVNYKELYTECYDKIEKYLSKSLQSAGVKVAAKLGNTAGKVAEKIPIVNKTPLDDMLLWAGDKLETINADKVKKYMSNLVELQGNSVRLFVENINTVNRLYNEPFKLLADKENLYISTTA